MIQADTRRFEAECPRLYAAPPFGSFVRVDGAGQRGHSPTPNTQLPTPNIDHRQQQPAVPHPTPSVYAVVSHVATGSVDAGRRAQALHLPPERLAERMPQLELVLRTCFTAQVIGYTESGDIRPYLPPHPPEIHRFVEPCTTEEVEALTVEPDFLRVLAAAADSPVEDLLASAILHAAAVRGAGAAADGFLVQCGKVLALLFRREPDSFQSIIRRLQAGRRPVSGMPWEQPLDIR